MTTALMTNIDTRVYNILNELAKQHNTSKKRMLEQIILFYHKQQEQLIITQAYETMAQDQEYLREMQDNSILLGYA